MMPDFNSLTASDHWVVSKIDWDAGTFEFPEVIGTNFAVVYESHYEAILGNSWVTAGVESSGGSKILWESGYDGSNWLYHTIVDNDGNHGLAENKYRQGTLLN
jgi:hypothetical protein